MMGKIRVRNRLLIFLVMLILGMAVIVVSESGFSQSKNELEKQAKKKTESASATAQNTTPIVSHTESPVVTGTPEPVRGEKIKKHKEGDALWSYNKETKCLVISGKGRISVTGSDASVGDVDPDYFPWDVWNKPCYKPSYADNVKKIIIEPGITYINAGAFYEYESLESVEISDTVTTLEEYAFWGCHALKSVILGDSVKTMGDGVFRNCSSLAEFTMGSSVKEIGNDVFSGCASLATVTIGRNVEKIGSNVFTYCSSLDEVKIDSDNTGFALESGILYNRQKTVLYRCLINVRNAEIPKSVRTISSGAFAGCGRLKNVSFSDDSDCSWIGKNAFSECVSLNEIRLPDSVQYVGNGTFYLCMSLQRVVFGSSFVGFTWADTWEEAEKSHNAPSPAIFVDGFVYGRIQEYRVSKSNPWYSSQDGVLYNKDKSKLLCYPQRKKDKTVKIPDSVKVIQGRAFEGNFHIEEVVLPHSLKRIGVGAFAWSFNLKSVVINGDQLVIASRAFCNCWSLSRVDLGDSVRQIKNSAFYDTGLTEIRIPPSVKKIGEDALGKWCARKRLEGGTRRYTTKDVRDFTIYGKKGSVAEHYAQEHVFNFVEI